MTGVSLAYLREIEAHVDVHCAGPSCGHTRRLTPTLAASMWGAETTVAELRDKLRCKACGREMDVRPCSIDISARNQVEVAVSRYGAGSKDALDALAEWEKSRPGDGPRPSPLEIKARGGAGPAGGVTTT